MFAVDTNVLIYAADGDHEFHAPCAKLLDTWRRQSSPWYLGWNVVYEFMRVVTHPQVLHKPWPVDKTMTFLEAIMATPSLSMLEPTPRHAVVLRQTLDEVPHLRGNILHDTHTAVLMREHGISRIYTRDTDFHRFGFLDVLDPLAG